jgi:hypothetical protein
MAERNDYRVGEGRNGLHVVLRVTVLAVGGYVELVAIAVAVMVTVKYSEHV